MRLTAAITPSLPSTSRAASRWRSQAKGESIEEALANLKEALELYFEDGSRPDMSEPPIIASVEIAA